MLTLSMPTRIEQLTGLRFVAAFVVLVSHFHSLASTSGLFFFSMLGNHGVTLFFVLSGFVLTHRYGGERITRISAHGSIYPALDWRKYAFARFARVAPAYWLSLLVAALAYAISGHEISLREPPSNTTQAILSFAVNWLALQAWVPNSSIQEFWNSPGWTISAEFFFYACFPALLRVRWLDGSVKAFLIVMSVFLMLLLGFMGILVLAHQLTAPMLAYGVRLPLLGLLPFVTGILLYRRLHRQPSNQGNKGFAIALTVATLLAVTAIEASWLSTFVELSSALWRFMLTQQLVYLPLLSMLLFLVAQDRGSCAKLLASAVSVRLGDASYALYIFHWLPLCYLVYHFGSGSLSWSTTVLCMLAVVCASLLIYSYFEVPMKAWLFKICRIQ